MDDALQRYIGRPWRADACGPEAYDCKGLVIAVQRELWGRTVPPLEGTALAWRDACRSTGWAPTLHAPQPGDVLLVRAADGPHVGVFVRAGLRLMVLHARSQIRPDGTQVGRVVLHQRDALTNAGYSRAQVWRFADAH